MLPAVMFAAARKLPGAEDGDVALDDAARAAPRAIRDEHLADAGGGSACRGCPWSTSKTTLQSPCLNLKETDALGSLDQPGLVPLV